MEKEIEYLNKKIEKIDHDIGVCKFGIGMNIYTQEELDNLMKEKALLISIRNEIKLNNYGD